MLYAGLPVEAPIAERTRKVQEWAYSSRSTKA